MKRPYFLELIERYFRSHQVLAILGPRQCGKMTLARQYSKKTATFPRANYFDLESPVDMERLKNPTLAFQSLQGLIIIDEILCNFSWRKRLFYFRKNLR